MDIIIVGCGKAGFLHASSYQKMAQDTIHPERVFLVEKIGIPKWLDLYTWSVLAGPPYSSIEELMSKEIIDPQNCIIDLCLPVSTFLAAVTEYKSKGFNKYIIEKPLIEYRESGYSISDTLCDVDFVMVQNYLYSCTTRTIYNLLSKYQLEPKMSIGDFSKDRRYDSSKYRAFASEQFHLTAWEIEIPHLIYINTMLFGKIVDTNYTASSDMETSKRVIKNHGHCTAMMSNQSGMSYIIHSDLERSHMVRTIDVICNDGVVIHGFFAPVCERTKGLKGGVFLIDNSNIKHEYFFEQDDNMLEMLRAYYKIFAEYKINKLHSVTEAIYYSQSIEKLVCGYNLSHYLDLSESLFVNNHRGIQKNGVLQAIGKSSLSYISSY